MGKKKRKGCCNCYGKMMGKMESWILKTPCLYSLVGGTPIRTIKSIEVRETMVCVKYKCVHVFVKKSTRCLDVLGHQVVRRVNLVIYKRHGERTMTGQTKMDRL